MQRTRRDILLFMGGGAAGAFLTPAPWRLVTDTAIWSENWPGIPRPEPGEVTFRYTNCALCPAGCAVRARLVNGQPVSLAGVAAHPLSHGALCAFGIAGHHLPYHPERLRTGAESEAAAAVAGAFARCAPGERVAVLDLLPGRAASSVYRRAMAALRNGVYLAPPRPLGGASVDLAKARTVLSLGAPLLAGWGTPGNVFAARANFRLIQAEPYESPTAALADEWLAIEPGSERALAQGLTDILKRQAAPAATAAATGLSEKQVSDLARELVVGGPALVLPAEDSPEAMALNEVLGAFGVTVVDRREAAGDEEQPAARPVSSARLNSSSASSLDSLADGSVRVLFIDESAPGAHIPWRAIEKKLASGSLVVAFGWSREGYARHAQFALPAAVYPEMTSDIPAPIDSPVAVFRLSTPLVPVPAGMVDPVAFIAKAAGIDPGSPLRERADAIHKSARGTLFTPADGKTTGLKDLKADDFWKALNEGGTWLDEPVQAARAGRKPGPAGAGMPPASAPGSAAFPLAVSLANASPATLASPLLAKLYQDSDLRLPPDTAVLHPETARTFGVDGATRGLLETACGSCAVSLVADPAVPPGLLQLWPGPESLDICGASPRAKVAAL